MNIWCVYSCMFNHVWLFATLWTVACQASLSMKFSRQEYWSGLPFLPPGESSWLRDQTCIWYVSCIGRWIFFTTSSTWEAPNNMQMKYSLLGSYLSIQSCPNTRIIGIQRKSEGKESFRSLCHSALEMSIMYLSLWFALSKSSVAAGKLTVLNGRL